MILKVIVSLFLAVFLTGGAFAVEGWRELEDPRPFVGACSFETAQKMSFEEAALNYQDHLGECIKIAGYYSTALYDGVEGFVLTNGDDWIGMEPRVLRRNRIGVYHQIESEEDFPSFPFERRNVEFAAILYNCSQWLADAGKQPEDQNYLFYGYCRYADGVIIVVHDYRTIKGQEHDPVLDLLPEIITEDGKIKILQGVDVEDTCTWEESQLENFTDVALKPFKFLGKCVRIEGLIVGSRTVYNGLTGLYLSQKVERKYKFPNQLGIYLLPDFSFPEGQWGKKQFFVELLGRIESCDQRGDAIWQSSRRATEASKLLAEKGNGEEQIIISMMAGYCHYYPGSVIMVSDIIEKEERIERFSGEMAKEKYGNLYFAEEDWEYRETFEEVVENWLSETIKNHVKKPENPNSSPLQRYLDLVSQKGDQNIKSSILLEFSDTDYPEDIGGNICFCLEEDCTNKWPISTVDVYYEKGLPYMCVFFAYFEDESSDEISVKPQWKK